MARRILLVLALVLSALIPAGAADAAASTAADKLAVMSAWSQPTAAGTAAWNGARADQGAWSAYGFDWSTDYCSASPDNPLGFRFKNSCAHHDFGYRNYKAVGQFAANKDRIDDYFYADLRRSCGNYPSVTRPACYTLAWIYYQAVRDFGSLAKVNQADIDKAARIKAEATR